MSSRIDSTFLESCMGQLEKNDGNEEVECIYDEVMGGRSEPEDEAEIKKNIIRTLLAAKTLSALYFIIRSAIMMLINGIMFVVAVYLLGTINLSQAIILGISIYVISLAVSKLLDRPVRRLTKVTIGFLNKHGRLRDGIINNL